MSQLEKLLQASVDLHVKDDYIKALEEKLALAECRIRLLECKLQRSRLPFRLQAQADTPALLRRQAE
jgi:hypothetical protein